MKELGPVDHRPMRDWITAIRFEDWPTQQSFTEVMPAMTSKLEWRGFGEIAAPLVAIILQEHFPACTAYQLMLSVVMPGHSIPPHKDLQPAEWLTRVHVPLVSNDESRFIVEGMSYVLSPGTAYSVNTMQEHAVENDGPTPRIHFMFDIRKG